MSMQQPHPIANWASFAPDKVLKTPLGAVSPLWAAYMGAAGAGVAFWWMTRWMQPANLEALFGREAQVKTLVAVAEPVLEVAEAAEVSVEATEAPPTEAPIEAQAEAAPEHEAPAPETDGLSPTAKALIARRKATTSAKATKPA